MCCRYVLLQAHTRSLLDQLGVLLSADALPPSRYNLPPGAGIPAIRTRPPARSAASADPKCHPLGDTLPEPARELTALRWGLVPSWARDDASPAVNARAESLAEKPAFRDAFRTRRCLIPASGFYEWKASGRAREPWFFRLRDERPFAFAGLWETWRAPDGHTLESCALVTTAPNSLMEPVHHRMPVILAGPAAWDAWLDPRLASPEALASLLRPFPAEAMTAIAVNPRVNNIRNDDPACLSPAEEQQLSMGF